MSPSIAKTDPGALAVRHTLCRWIVRSCHSCRDRLKHQLELIVVLAYTLMAWEVEYTDEFGTWWASLTVAQQEALDDRVMLLAEVGPGLRRPVVGSISLSRHANMRELRASTGGALRVLFAFDPRRHVILLLGGDKSGEWNEWYEWAIPQADGLYDAYLRELEDEGLLD